MCGADDCPNCHPENFRGGIYIDGGDAEETVTDTEILSAMTQFGGGFVKALASAARLADEDNLQRIKDTWPEYWFKYSAMAKSSNVGCER